MKYYFSKHYAKLNNIDLESERSINKWLSNNYLYFKKSIPKFVDSFENKKILELGCGIGGFLYYLKRESINDYIGVDNSQEQLMICKKYVTDKIVNDDVVDFLRKNKIKYDLIILYDLIEHFEQGHIMEFITLIYSALNVKGKILLRTPNMSIPLGLHNRYIDFTHKIGFTEQSIKQLFSEFDFSNIEVFNDVIGWKRLFAVQVIQRILGKLYNMKLSEIVTPNLILVAIK